MFQLILSVYCGSENMVEGTQIEVTGSRGVGLKDPRSDTAFSSSLIVSLPAGAAFSTVSLELVVVVELENRKDANSTEHNLTLVNPWTNTSKDIALHFVPVIYSSFLLLTAMSRKFLQVSVHSPAVSNVVLKQARVELLNEVPGLELTPVSQKYPELRVCRELEGSYLWELKVDEVDTDDPAKIKFSVDYTPEGKNEPERSFAATFQFQDYKTLYTIHAKVEPAKGALDSILFRKYRDI